MIDFADLGAQLRQLLEYAGEQRLKYLDELHAKRMEQLLELAKVCGVLRSDGTSIRGTAERLQALAALLQALR